MSKGCFYNDVKFKVFIFVTTVKSKLEHSIVVICANQLKYLMGKRFKLFAYHFSLKFV